MTSLELLPLFSGVDTDVEIFASGNVAEDEGDWAAGAQPLAAAEGEAAKADGAGGSGGARWRGGVGRGVQSARRECEA